MLYLVGTIAALAVGPLLVWLVAASKARLSQVALDVVVLVAVGGLVLLNILPHSFEEAGWLAIGALLVGLLLPTAVELWVRRFARQAHTAVRVVIVVGLAAHALMDGVALHGGHGLPLAVVLHRLPAGLVLWWLVRPSASLRTSVGVLLLVAVATVIGFAAGSTFVLGLHSETAALFQAFVAGSLLHIAVHQRRAHVH